MARNTERRSAARRRTDSTGTVALGQEEATCRVIDVSDAGAQIRIDGRRASRNLHGRRVSLTIDSRKAYRGNVVWVRPAVNGVYLGLQFDGAEDERARA